MDTFLSLKFDLDDWETFQDKYVQSGGETEHTHRSNYVRMKYRL
jgi:hypothetical protein